MLMIWLERIGMRLERIGMMMTMMKCPAMMMELRATDTGTPRTVLWLIQVVVTRAAEVAHMDDVRLTPVAAVLRKTKTTAAI